MGCYYGTMGPWIDQRVQGFNQSIKWMYTDSIRLIENMGQGFTDTLETEGISYIVGGIAFESLLGYGCAKVIEKIADWAKAGKNAGKVAKVVDEGGSTSAFKIGSTKQAVQNFTREEIVNSLDGVIEKSTEIASAIRNQDIGINVLGDELFESYLGCAPDTVAMQIGDQIYVRSSSTSLISDVVHEGTHAMDYLNDID